MIAAETETETAAPEETNHEEENEALEDHKAVTDETEALKEETAGEEDETEMIVGRGAKNVDGTEIDHGQETEAEIEDHFAKDEIAHNPVAGTTGSPQPARCVNREDTHMMSVKL